MTIQVFASSTEREAVYGFLALQRAALIRQADEPDTVEQWVACFNEQASVSRQITADADLDVPCAWPPLAHRNFRWVPLPAIEETARHPGHADIIRQSIWTRRAVDH